MSPHVTTNGNGANVNGDTTHHPHPQKELPRLPIPPLEDSLRRYLRALEGLQNAREHAATKRAVEDFLHGEGPLLHNKLVEYAKDKARCVMLKSDC